MYGKLNTWLMCLVYATPYENKKPLFLSYLTVHVSSYDGKWVALGDFIEITTSHKQ